MFNLSKTIPSFLIASTLLATVLFTGCRIGEPSESDITQAYQNELAQTKASAQKLGVPEMNLHLNGLKKKKCTVVDNQKRYRCQVEMDLTLPMVGKTITPSTLLLQQTQQGWVIDRSESSE